MNKRLVLINFKNNTAIVYEGRKQLAVYEINNPTAEEIEAIRTEEHKDLA